jgi:hypothetical protein
VLILKVLVIWTSQLIIPTALAVTNNNSVSTLFTINLTTGKVSCLGTFSAQVISIAFKTNQLLMLPQLIICFSVLILPTELILSFIIRISGRREHRWFRF